jgi:hypothetical protein
VHQDGRSDSHHACRSRGLSQSLRSNMQVDELRNVELALVNVQLRLKNPKKLSPEWCLENPQAGPRNSMVDKERWVTCVGA